MSSKAFLNIFFVNQDLLKIFAPTKKIDFTPLIQVCNDLRREVPLGGNSHNQCFKMRTDKKNPKKVLPLTCRNNRIYRKLHSTNKKLQRFFNKLYVNYFSLIGRVSSVDFKKLLAASNLKDIISFFDLIFSLFNCSVLIFLC